MRRPPSSFAVATALLFAAGAASAHVPHDVAQAIALSPAFPDDPTVFGAFSLIDQRVFGLSRDGGLDWQEVGTAMTQHGVEEFAMSPAFPSDGTCFAATDAGVYRTRDAGASWQRVGLAGLACTDVATSPAFASDGVVLCTTTTGLHRSSDGGDTWTPVTNDIQETDLAAVAFAPDDADGLVAFAGGKIVHRSDDGGATWTPLRAFTDRFVEFAPSPAFTSDARLLAAFRVTGVFQSVDGGHAWTSANAGITDLLALDVDIAPSGEVFVTTRTDGVFRAEAFGQPFALHMDGIEPFDETTSAHYREVRVSPQFAVDGTVFLACTEGVFVSRDGGLSWTQSDIFHQRVDPRVVISPDFARDGEVYVTNYGGGVFLWTEPRGAPLGARGGPASATAALGQGPASGPPSGVPGGGAGASSLDAGRWEARSNGLATLHPDGLAVSPAFADDGTLFYAFTLAYRSHDRGATWTQLTMPTDLARDIAVSTDFPADGQVMIGTNGNGVFLSHDAGETWSETTTGLPAGFRTRRILFSPAYASDATIFIASWDQGVWVSHDGAATWDAANSGISELQLQSLAISPSFADDGTLLAGTRGDGLFMTVDGGANWTQVIGSFDLSDAVILSGVAFSPDWARDGTAFATTLAGTIHRTTDGGATWQLVGAGFGPTAARDVVVSPDFVRDRTLFVSSHEGLWRSRDAGLHFEHVPGWMRVDDTHAGIVATGVWPPASAADVDGKGVSGSTQPGDTRTYRFFGDSLRWHALAASDAGIAELWVDGALVDTVDLYAPADTPVVALERAWDEPGPHEFVIVATGGANPLASDARVFDDGCTITR